ncbi:MAG: FecR domain-containing protein [Bacteroidota bacterium]
MKLKEEYIDELIAKYLAGEALPEEAMMLDEWKQGSAEHEQYFAACAEAMQLTTHLPIDTSRLYKRITMQAKINEPKRFSLTPYITPLRIAASLLILSLAGFIFYIVNKQSLAPEKIYATANQTISEQLADGSTVTLNKQSKLTLISGFNGKQRKSKLEGEAYFEVVHNAEKPFTIDAGGIEITDIGTAFNVKANPTSDTVIIQVTEGIVNLSTPDTSLQLTAHQTALFVRSKQLLRTVTHFDENTTAYRTKKFRFNAQKLSEVIATLNEVYDQHFVLTNLQLSECLITVDFNNETPDTIADIISATLGISYRKTDKGYLFIGNACIQ